ncbi:Ankyrin repeat domain-containing protein [Tetrabaena socialis]|uniref:Ankyrin repeat domain-containing protein n=1 Tax=Tetrabaena socialis TaxID=47790 RepID=A0A2J8A8C6_9CHLO|nr:Ankyrin repeat domain-containing protein [Tetrabaena socialis]|eukprot:PNH08755.1 Ankyrin repeat domain-containing protein [Tetrabaena socialis]
MAAEASDPPCLPPLPADLVMRVLGRLPPNEVAVVARLVCKAAAELFAGPQHTTVRLSQPVPHHEFARRWGDPHSTRPLTLMRRRELVSLTAASGDVDNLKFVALRVGCLTHGDMPPAEDAAPGLLLDEGWWLQDYGCFVTPNALTAAALAGRQSVVDWLLAHGLARYEFGEPPAFGAARGGHVGLMDCLMQRDILAGTDYHRVGLVTPMLTAVAEGCDLPTLQRLHHTYLDSRGLRLPRFPDHVVGAAAHSPTPDWQAKLEWLEERGYSLKRSTMFWAATCPDALTRLAWLRDRGCEADTYVMESAAGSDGNLEGLKYLLAQGSPVEQGAWRSAAMAGCLAKLEALHAHGSPIPPCTVRWAAFDGHQPAVFWLLGGLGEEQRRAALDADLLSYAMNSGCLTLLAWLREAGCPWGEDTFAKAAEAGSEEVLEWLAEQGCPMGVDGAPYVEAGCHFDFATLSCLRRLGCPWDEDGGTFTAAARACCRLPALRWLLQHGCPVDWDACWEEPFYTGDECYTVTLQDLDVIPGLQKWWQQQ